MKMKQRAILNQINPDFAREGEDRAEFLQRKVEEIKASIREYMKYCGKSGFIVNLTGGPDSFAAAALTADAIKDCRGMLYIMLLPNGANNDIEDAEACRDAIMRRFDNVESETVSIEKGVSGIREDIRSSALYDQNDSEMEYKIVERVRMIEKYALAKDLLVLGTDHATENMVGYLIKYGDGGCDFNPLSGLVKIDIYEIAMMYGAPPCVERKDKETDIAVQQANELEPGLTYGDLTAYLTGHVIEKELMQRIYHLYEAAEHKRHLPASPQNTWWKEGKEDVTFLVIDMIHAFVDGSMPCENAENAVQATVAFLNHHPEMRVLYVRDCHPAEHCSFEEFGGRWPAHAIQGTEDCQLVQAFQGVRKTINSPLMRYNVFNKGEDELKEEYSGFNAVNENYGALKFNLTGQVVISGMATEYCVKETAKDLLKMGFQVSILKDGLGYMDQSQHEQALQELIDLGAKLIYS